DNVVQLLRRIFIKNYKQVDNERVRTAHGKLAGAFGIFTNLILFVGKLIAGFLSLSISIIADGINNLADMASSIVTLIGFKLASAPADKEHPYGHQRIEYVSGLIISVVIFLVGGSLLVSSIEKIIEFRQIVLEKRIIIITIIILSCSILIKLWQGLFNRRIGIIINSVALKATSKDSLNDCISTFALLIGNIVLLFTNNIPFSLDGVLGIIVSVFIIVSGLKLIKDTVDPLIGGTIDPQIVNKVLDIIKEERLILGYHDLICHMYGPTKCFMTLHVEVDANQRLLDIHDIIDNLERKAKEKFDIDLTLHMDPIQIDNPEINELRRKVRDTIENIDVNLSMHDFRVVMGNTHTNIIFDLVRPFKFRLSDGEILKEIQKAFEDEEKKYYFVVHFDYDYVEKDTNYEFES
ncbi:MAG: cation diffusion facilitator family transporter, partial [Anaeroplasmataceae bacterium]|nr:cation diffusion facilitator family transporter [Anaeroplasmataceae bacterium]